MDYITYGYTYDEFKKIDGNELLDVSKVEHNLIQRAVRVEHNIAESLFEPKALFKELDAITQTLSLLEIVKIRRMDVIMVGHFLELVG